VRRLIFCRFQGRFSRRARPGNATNHCGTPSVLTANVNYSLPRRYLVTGIETDGTATYLYKTTRHWSAMQYADSQRYYVFAGQAATGKVVEFADGPAQSPRSLV